MSESNRHGERLARWAAREQVGTPPVPAATVVLVRDAAARLQTLMLRRNSRIAFGGMWVFPGGRIDDADRVENDDLTSARVAAVREAGEEAGLVLDPGELVPFSHWTPPPITPKRYVTWFFIAHAPDGAVLIDGGEIHEHAWMGPAEALEKRAAGEIELAPPTFVTLFELARCGDARAALALAGTREPERFATVIGRAEGGAVAMWHGDAGYDAADPGRPGARHRLSMVGSGWSYERSDA